MKYERIKPAVFLERPNRFVAHVLLEGQAEKTVCHVKNTDRKSTRLNSSHRL